MLAPMKNRLHFGLAKVQISRAVRAELLLAGIQAAIDHQRDWRRPWQRYEPLSTFLDSEIWRDDQSVLYDLSYAKLAIQMLSEAQRQDLEAALEE
jgi:hypothetical protein